MVEDTNGNSEWTKEALYTHFIQLLKEKDERNHDRFKELDEKIKSSVGDLREHTSNLVSSQEKAINIAMAAADKAIIKAEVASEKRFEGQNEFRKTVEDQQKFLMPRGEAELKIKILEEKIQAIQSTMTSGSGVKLGVKEAIGYILFVLMVVFYLITIFR